MRMIIDLELTADIDEEAMTVDEKLDFIEEILRTGCEACCADYHLKLLKFKE